MFMAESFVANATKLTHDNILTNRKTIQGGGAKLSSKSSAKRTDEAKLMTLHSSSTSFHAEKNGKSGCSFRRPSLWIVSLPFQILSPFPQDMTNVMGKRSPRIEK